MIQKSLQFIKAGSKLGLKPTGVEDAPDFLLKAGLHKLIMADTPLIEIPTLNHLYSVHRDSNGMINAQALRSFSDSLLLQIETVINKNLFPVVLGGDCSILIGIMAALKSCGEYGLVTLDAHADFYDSMESTSGEAADMDIALVTGRGPDLLTDINGLKPYVEDRKVIHIGQRDEEETLNYGSQQIQQTAIKRFSMEDIQRLGIRNTLPKIENIISDISVQGYWIHFDTDVLSNDENPAVDYRLPGGLSFSECEELIKGIMATGKVMGVSISIYNPKLDIEKTVCNKLAELIQNILTDM